jgi:DNA-binding MarR family transcriptional regulator
MAKEIERLAPPERLRQLFEGESDISRVPKSRRGLLAGGVTMRVGHLFSRWFDRMVDSDFSASGPRLMLLAVLNRHKTLTMGEAAELLDVTPRAVTRLADALEEEGLISRQSSPLDKRVFLISVTPKTIELFKKHMPKHEQLMTEMFSVFTDEELVEFVRLNGKLAAHLKKAI